MHLMFSRLSPARRALYLRRIGLVTLVLVALSAFLSGCASVETQCGMGGVWATNERLPSSGSVRVDWLYEQNIPAHRYGESYVLNGQTVIRMKGEPPHWGDTCGLAKLGHEIAHSYRSHQ